MSGSVFAFAAAASLVLAAEPETRPSPIQPAFGNTIVSTYPDGRTAKLWLDPDGSYRGEGRRGDASRGQWALRADKLCLKQARPIPVPFAFCTSIPSGGLGAGWAAKAVTGEPVRVQLTPGR